MSSQNLINFKNMEEEKNLENKKSKSKIYGTVLIALFIFVSGFYLGSKNSIAFQSMANTGSVSDTLDLAPFWKAWKMLEDKNINAGNVSNQDKVYGAIQGLAQSYGDPYTVFFPPKDAKDFNEQIEGSFGGIGVEIGIKDKILTIISPIKGTPGFLAGLKAGDKIISIDKKATSGMTIEEAISLIHGTKGTKVTLEIFRTEEKKTRVVEIIRDTIQVPILDEELRSDGVYKISLYEFTAGSAEQFTNALKNFAKSNSNKLIIDLRGNPGGYLSSAIEIASYFVPSGQKIVSEDFGAKKDPIIHTSSGYKLLSNKKNMKVVVLIDEGSASASEILAGALSENKAATLVGTQSYGKGSVQEVDNVTDDTVLKITIAKWLTPLGNSISQKGITPDYVISPDPEGKVDTQLNKALEIIKK